MEEMHWKTYHLNACARLQDYLAAAAIKVQFDLLQKQNEEGVAREKLQRDLDAAVNRTDYMEAARIKTEIEQLVGRKQTPDKQIRRLPHLLQAAVEAGAAAGNR